MGKYSEDERLLQELKTGDDQYIKKVLESRFEPYAAFIMKKFQCKKERVEEIYYLSFSKFYFAIKNEKLAPPLKAFLQTYLNKVGRNDYLNRFSKGADQHENSVDDFPILGVQAWAEINLEAQDRANFVKNLLNQLDPKCRKIIEDHFIHERPPREVAEELGNRNGHSSSKKASVHTKIKKNVEPLKNQLILLEIRSI